MVYSKYAVPKYGSINIIWNFMYVSCLYICREQTKWKRDLSNFWVVAQPPDSLQVSDATKN